MGAPAFERAARFKPCAGMLKVTEKPPQNEAELQARRVATLHRAAGRVNTELI